MHDATSWLAAWQSIAPVFAGVFMIVMMKWLSRHWAAGTIARTARVVSRLEARRALRRRAEGRGE
jgi:hypothetical protein